jgi:tRNA nucleotidyltransferase (CCA-adding enzyme)
MGHIYLINRKIDMNYIEIVKRLCGNGCDTYIVGGAVRDILENKSPKDIDIVTQATPEQVEHLFADRKVKVVGKSFGVVLVDGYEVATFRHDRHNGIGDKNCTVVYANSIQEDLSRRDLTVNAMALCELTGELVDEHKGKEHLEKRLIKFVGDPILRIVEDPNRIIRACRFLARLEGRFSHSTLEALKQCAPMIKDHIAPERIRLEIMKAMEIKTASLFFSALQTIGALEFVIPEMCRSIFHEHGKHHVENVWEHNMLCGDDISTKYPIVKLAGYMHDIGKPKAYNLNDGQSFVDHERLGRALAVIRLYELKFSNQEVDKIANLIECHMRPIKDLKSKGVRKLKKFLADRDVDFHDWMRVRIADRKANVRKDPLTFSEIKKACESMMKVKDVPMTVNDLAMSGGDIIEASGLNPGPEIGRIQRGMLSYVLDMGEEYNTEKQLQHFLDSHY